MTDQPTAATLEPQAQWGDEQIKAVAFGVATKYLMDKSAGKGTPITQLIESKMIEMRDAILAEADDVMAGNVRRIHEAVTPVLNEVEQLRAQLAELQAENARLRVECLNHVAQNDNLRAMLKAGNWQPIDYLINDQLEEIHVDEIAVTIGYDDTAMATFAWPEEGQYAVCRLYPAQDKESEAS